MGAETSAAIWENSHDRISYTAPRGHAFSYYLEGGTGTRRLDVSPRTGRPGVVCIMPEGQTSEWEITTPFRFVHLYIPDNRLRAAFAQVHDCDARRMDLPELTFDEGRELALPLVQLSQAARCQDILLADAALSDLVGRLGKRAIAVKGGLPVRQLRRIDEWIDAHLEDRIRLADIAHLADLSPFHLHRMFRMTRGIALHGWVTNRRITRAKKMLEGSSPLIEIAHACGFSSQSHFSRVFKEQTSMTPSAYRAVRRGP
ncbi:helix-turn-helix domain-containing protein [Profundibacterium mesophilum]|uniref:Transcriptional regulator AraC family protein n=1 Tax=Profundibacterium mesophilum KAUST100406-0324 TaxID=1037889 RepID=A0A921P1G2_9RHOB|nr:AraC family transcriptional regulator [Profundibacterium mesophilum]KAF0677453.1 Transcriptional regulator AraC family protein [Profundibacterium mesophilum KAUST100406-0324]